MSGILLTQAGAAAGGGSSPGTITIASQTIFDSTTGSTSTAYYELHADGYVYQTNHVGTTNIGQWCNPLANAANYEAFVTVSYGALTTGTAGSWLRLNSNRIWGVQQGSVGSRQCIITAGVRLYGGDGTILDSGDMNLLAEYN